ncbi:MAG: class C sortase [Promicromonosporaceae bacterium]|nr:class C sortase [Promicromonosporaceae bacterium]
MRKLVWVLLITISAGLGLYPQAANWFNVRAQSSEMERFVEAVAAMSQEDTQALLERADAFNELLAAAEAHNELLAREGHTPEGYYEQLRVGDSNVMAQINVPSIDLAIAVFHGVSDLVLDRAAGHHPATSLPVGGESTHAVITAHTGLPNARLFNRLIDVGLGDVIIVTVPGRTLFYEVTRLTVVLPGDYLEYLTIEDGEDLLTLFTCTPYGVNSHRLLVTAQRIEDPEAAGVLHLTADPIEAGLPIWAALFTGAVLAGIGSGRLIFGSNNQGEKYRPRHAR